MPADDSPYDNPSLSKYLDTVQNNPTLVYFSASWCNPCRRIAPVYENLKKDAPSSVRFFKIDVDQCDDIAAKEGITAMPTFLFYCRGNIISTLQGANPTELKNQFNILVQMGCEM